MKAVHILNMLAYCHEVCSDHAVCMLTTGDPHQATPQPPRLSKGVDQFVMDDLGADKPRSSARAAAPYIDMVSERASERAVVVGSQRRPGFLSASYCALVAHVDIHRYCI